MYGHGHWKDSYCTVSADRTRFLTVTFLLLIFLSLLVYFILKGIYCSSVTVCLHKCTIISVTESAHGMHIINVK